MPRRKIQVWTSTKSNNSKSMMPEMSYGSCALHFSSMRSIYLWSFMMMAYSFEIMLRTKKGRTTDWLRDWQTDGRTCRLLYVTPRVAVRDGVGAAGSTNANFYYSTCLRLVHWFCNSQYFNFKYKTRGPRGPWVAHLRKRSKVTV